MNLRAWWKRVVPHEKRTSIAIKLLSAVLPLLHRSWRITEENRDGMERARVEQGGVIMVTWHGRALVPFTIMMHKKCYALVSLSNDGDLLSRVLEAIGWGIIRGSSGRGAITAIKQAKAVLAEPGAMLAFTPDGPRGPSGVAKSGMIYLARKTGKPLFPVGIAATPRYLFRSWDRFMVPLPFARCHFIYGEPIEIDADEDLEAATLRVQIAISAVEARAERYLGQEPLPASYRPLHAAPLVVEEQNEVGAVCRSRDRTDAPDVAHSTSLELIKDASGKV